MNGLFDILDRVFTINLETQYWGGIWIDESVLIAPCNTILEYFDTVPN